MLVILDNLRSALNVGSIIRTCDALGVKEIYFSGITPDINNKKVTKTSLGAEKNIEFDIFSNTNEAISKAKEYGFRIIGLEVTKEATNIKNFKLPNNKIALVVGNEVSGLSSEIIKQCDELIKIEMLGVKESLNVAVAFGIAAFFINSKQ